MVKEIYDVDKHKSKKEAIREKLKNLKKTKANQKIYHELMENLS